MEDFWIFVVIKWKVRIKKFVREGKTIFWNKLKKESRQTNWDRGSIWFRLTLCRTVTPARFELSCFFFFFLWVWFCGCMLLNLDTFVHCRNWLNFDLDNCFWIKFDLYFDFLRMLKLVKIQWINQLCHYPEFVCLVNVMKLVDRSYKVYLLVVVGRVFKFVSSLDMVLSFGFGVLHWYELHDEKKEQPYLVLFLIEYAYTNWL